MKVRVLACVLALAIPVGAQEKAAPEKPEKASGPKADAERPQGHPGPYVQRIVPVKNVEKMRTLRDLANAFGAQPVEFRDLGILVLRAPSNVVAAAEAAIQKYDVESPSAKPQEPKNLELIAYLLVAGQEPSPAAQGIPETLAPVVAQLKERFPYKHYELAETLALRVNGNRPGQISGVLPGLSTATRDQKTFYELVVEGVAIPPRANVSEPFVEIGKLRFQMDVAIPITGKAADRDFARRELSIQSGLELREGQKVVVGKTTLDGSNSLILVLTVKVV